MPIRGAVLLTPLITVLVGCGSATGEAKGGAAGGGEAGTGAERIACAPGGAQKFADECVVERSQDQGKLFLTVRHSDGGFRRFEVMTDGTGLATADGAQDAKVAVADGLLDVSVGVDRYRFPATVKPGVKAEQGAKGDAAASQ